MDKKVMIVDDEEYIRLAVGELLMRKGLEVVKASGAKECLEAVRSGFRGVILMDIMMPNLDGWDTIRMLVTEGLFDGIIVLMLTAKDQPDQKMEGLQEYVTDYLTKPFDSDELVSIVKDTLEYLEE